MYILDWVCKKIPNYCSVILTIKNYNYERKIFRKNEGSFGVRK